MRSILFALAMLGAGLSSPAWSQSWSGALPAVQGEERTLTFEVANLGDLVAWNIYLAFSPLAFATPGIVPSIVLDPALDTFEAGPALAPVASDFADPIPAGYLEIVVSASHVFPISGSARFSQRSSAPCLLRLVPPRCFRASTTRPMPDSNKTSTWRRYRQALPPSPNPKPGP